LRKESEKVRLLFNVQKRAQKSSFGSKTCQNGFSGKLDAKTLPGNSYIEYKEDHMSK
jgi:hypothetical protein